LSNNNAGVVGGAIVSGVIAAVIGAAVVGVLSRFNPFPWDFSSTIFTVAVSSFFGSAAGFSVGRTLSPGSKN
jgi:uncharacterized membrane protein